ncbi:hypothetical protein FA95DRAFT_1419942 [Auriscalpium vulgare]|uniref:Uncharacterized protein n=1 Tax=Auriscalpium vulgare TaxID=40419 RepID=A0ACB8RR52_9AGAM|nr:hypothetical protein FA95DRAFT_1419942 [Auriscalpium vulgare]
MGLVIFAVSSLRKLSLGGYATRTARFSKFYHTTSGQKSESESDVGRLTHGMEAPSVVFRTRSNVVLTSEQEVGNNR